jgi:hypothetical protein
MRGGVASTGLDRLRLSRLDVLKINERVSAPGLLAGSREALGRLWPVVSLVAPDAQSIGASQAVLEACGYACTTTAVPLFSPRNFNRRTENVFGTLFRFSLLALPPNGGRLPS